MIGGNPIGGNPVVQVRGSQIGRRLGPILFTGGTAEKLLEISSPGLPERLASGAGDFREAAGCDQDILADLIHSVVHAPVSGDLPLPDSRVAIEFGEG